MKIIVIADLSLADFDPRINVVVVSDASEYRIKAVSLYKYKDASTKPVIHVSLHAESIRENNIIR